MLAAALLFFFQEDPLAAQSLVNGQGDAGTVDLIAFQLESGAAIDMDGRLDEEAWERAPCCTRATASLRYSGCGGDLLTLGRGRWGQLGPENGL